MKLQVSNSPAKGGKMFCCAQMRLPKEMPALIKEELIAVFLIFMFIRSP